jgi:probable phosphoglycerate mutase
MNSIPSQRIYLLRHGAVQGFDRKTYYEICENTLSDTIIVAHAGVNRVILAGMMDICLKDILKIPQDYAAGYVIEITPTEKNLHANKLPHMLNR